MKYNYTVTLQSKQGPKRYKTTGQNLTEVIDRLKRTLLPQGYTLKAIIRSPQK